MDAKFNSIWEKVHEVCISLSLKISVEELEEWDNKLDILFDEKDAFEDDLKKWQHQKYREACPNRSDASTQTQEEVEILESHPLSRELQLMVTNVQGPQASSTGKPSQRNDRLSTSTWESANDSGFLESPESPRCALSPDTIASVCMRQVFDDEHILRSRSYCMETTPILSTNFHGGQQTPPMKSPECPAFVTECPVTESGSLQAQSCSHSEPEKKSCQAVWVRVKTKLSSSQDSFSHKCSRFATTLHQQVCRFHNFSSNFKWKTSRKLAALHRMWNSEPETDHLEMQFVSCERTTTKLQEYKTLLAASRKVHFNKDLELSPDHVPAGGGDPILRDLKAGSKPTLTTQNRGQPGDPYRPNHHVNQPAWTVDKSEDCTFPDKDFKSAL